MEKNAAYLVLENGRVFKGEAFGVAGEVTAEVVFTTGMTGYLETLTDQSHYGQIVVQTFPLIGNYGVIPEDFESSSVALSAYIVKHWCQLPSNFRCEGDIDAFLKAKNIVGLCGIDTRTLTKIIREQGVMNGCITRDPDRVDLEALRRYKVQGAVGLVSAKAPYEERSDAGRYRVALMDYGLKANIKRELKKRGCDLIVCPHDMPHEEVLALKPDGIMLSNGPGDPRENATAIETLRGLMPSGIPMFGICLGHQLLALANGFATEKLKYGHRGGNQPVKHTQTGKVSITSQNHGYAVMSQSIDPKIGRELFVNVNDGTCEGIEYSNAPAFSVQFHPEGCSGPKDTSDLFDRFIDAMDQARQARGNGQS